MSRFCLPTLAIAAAGSIVPSTLAQAQGAGTECMDDGDCAADFQCLKGASTPGCDPSAGACDAGIKVEEYGYCEPRPIVCDSDADCPEGLRCEESGDTGNCASSRDGGTVCEPPQPIEQHCSYAPEQCTSDTDCAADFACTVLATIEECSGGGVACPDGEECPEPMPDTCTTREEKYCFPDRKDCEGDDDCAASWRCTPIPPEARGDRAPSGWEDATAACLPEGLALAAEGRVEGKSVFEGHGSSGGADGGAYEGSAATGDDARGSGGGGACSTHAPGSARFAFAEALALLGAVIGLTRRRAATRV